MAWKSKRCLSSSQPLRGIAAVECAIVAPVLVLLVLGTVDVGQFANVHQQVNDASRAGARFAVLYNTTTTSQVRAMVLDRLADGFPGVTAEALASAATVRVSNSSGETVSGGDLTTISSGSEVHVQVRIPYDTVRWLDGLPGLSGAEVDITTTMRRQ